MRRRFLAPVVAPVVVLLISACSVQFGGASFGSNASPVPMNEGRRLDMLIERSPNTVSDLTATVRVAWTGNNSLSSWFIIVDRLIDPDATVILEYDFRGVTRRSERVGTPKYGYRTIYTSMAIVDFALVDVRSGLVLASATGNGSGSGEDIAGLDERAVRSAIGSGLNRLLSNYAGGRS